METTNKNPWQKTSSTFKRVVFTLLLIVALVVTWMCGGFNWIPGMTSAESKKVVQKNINNDALNFEVKTDKLDAPAVGQLRDATRVGRPEIRIMNWVWFGNAPIFTANGGPNTMSGTLMDERGLNVRMITNNSVSAMKIALETFISAYANGDPNPSDGVQFLTVMGDGAAPLITEVNKLMTKAHGPEYKVKIIGAHALSMGEDCLVGPKKWKDDWRTMKGAVISAVIGDGDWALVVRYCSGEHGLKINPDPTTYDPEAVNFVPAPDDDFMKAAEDARTGRKVQLKVKDAKGNFTRETKEFTIEGAATWFPGDKELFDATDLVKVISTSQYPNQMGCVIIGCDKWMKENREMVVNFLSAVYQSSNQIKQYDEWFRAATKIAPTVFCAPGQDCPETPSDWYRYAKPNGGKMLNNSGTEVLAGGTQMMNLAEARKYFGVDGKVNYYREVYNYFSGVITQLNPNGIIDNLKKLDDYEEAVDLTYLKDVKVESTIPQEPDYQKNRSDDNNNKSEQIGDRPYNIQFKSGSAEILPEALPELEALFKALSISINSNAKIIGHTDDQGRDDDNLVLSERRAQSVMNWLMKESGNEFSKVRFDVQGKGESEPLVNSTSADARRQNRRVQIVLYQKAAK